MVSEYTEEYIGSVKDRLNPCCYGRWSQSCVYSENGSFECLNPCCYGRWSQSVVNIAAMNEINAVLILVVMEDGLREQKMQCDDH